MKLSSIVLGGMALCFVAACQPQIHASAIEVIAPDNLPALGPYSPAIKANGMLYVSGTIAFNPETSSFAPATIEAQTHQVFKNLKAVLAAGGCTLEDSVKLTVYLKNPKDFPAMNVIYAQYFPDYKPARSTVPGIDWGRDNILIEIDVIAKIP